MPQINFNHPKIYSAPKNKKGGRLLWGSGGVVLAFLIFYLSGTSHSVGIENVSWWQKLSSLLVNVSDFKLSQSEELKKLFPQPAKESGRSNFLILGLRGKDDPDGGLLTDTIMLLSFNQLDSRLELISIPRDLYVDMPSLFKGKINEIYERGWARNQNIKFSQDVFSRLTGIHINHVVVFNFQAFQEIIDTLGGIDLYLKRPFEEISQWGYPFFLPEGADHLDGATALYYVRSRYSSSDFDRARRQQEVIFAIKKKVLSLDLLTSPLKVTALLSNLKNNIATDLNIWNTTELISLASALNASADRLKTDSLTTDNLLMETSSDGIYILLPRDNDWLAFQSFFKNIFAPTKTTLPQSSLIKPKASP